MKHENLPAEQLEQAHFLVAHCLAKAGLSLVSSEETFDSLEDGKVGLTVSLAIPGMEDIPVMKFTGSLKELHQSVTAEKSVLRCDGLEVDCRRRRASLGGEPLALTPREFQLLTYLLQNRNQVLTRGQLLGSVWELGYAGDNRTVDTHIKCLRRKLGEFGRHIVTVRKVGYRFETFTK